MLCKLRAAPSHFLFSFEMKISMELARSCCRPKLHPSLRSIFLSGIGLWVEIWHRNKTACSVWNPVQSSRSKSTTCPRKEERTSAQIQIEQHSDFRWRHIKAWKRCQAWFWINLNQSLQPNCSQMKCDVQKPCSSDQHWQDELRFSIWRYFEQSAFVNNHLLCYWPAIHKLIQNIFPKFQVISSQGQWAAQWALNKNCATWKYFNSDPCRMRQNVSTKGLRSRILVFRVWPWYSTWQKNRESCTWLLVAKYNESCTVFFGRLIWTYGIVVKVSLKTICRPSALTHVL